MKEKKLIFPKLLPAFFAVCAMLLLFDQTGKAAQEEIDFDKEMEEAIVDEDDSSLDIFDEEAAAFADPPFSEEAFGWEKGEDSLNPLWDNQESIFPETDFACETDAGDMNEEIKEGGDFEEGEKESDQESGKESALLNERAFEGPFPLPVEEMTGFFVSWINAKNETIFWNDRGNTGGSLSDISGTYTLRVQIICGEECTALAPGNIYTIQLDWPKNDEAVVSLSENQGEIIYSDMTGFREVYIGSWALDEKGVLTLTMDDNDEAASTNRWEGYFSVQVSVNHVYDEPAISSAVSKTSFYDPASQSITWTITADIPAYAGSGILSSWYMDDDVTAALGTRLNNDMADVSVTVSSKGYTGKIPAFSDADEGFPLAYALEDLGILKERLVFLTPCTCEAENCQNYQGVCKNTYGTGKDGRSWCSCWDYRYNSSFAITYSVDVAPVLQDLASQNLGMGTFVMNNVGLWKDKSGPFSYSTIDFLENVIDKEEVRLPGRENDYTSSYRIRVNPAGENYASAEYLTITDSMTNLSLEKDSLKVMAGGGDYLEQLSDVQIAALDRGGNEDRYFSLEASKVEDDADGMPKQILQIKIWYPTDKTYSITYDAMVVDPKTERDDSYGNEAVLGGVRVLTKGKGNWAAEEWDGMSNAVTLEKIDADEKDQVLSGAVFEVYRYVKDKEDTLITTLTTGEDGRAVFQTDRREGYFVKCDTLYYFREIQAPPGYSCGDERIWFYLQGSQTEGISKNDLPANLLDENGIPKEDANLYVKEVMEEGQGNLFIKIENTKEEPDGVMLPETGGPGELPGRTVGLILIFASAAILIFKRQNQKIRRQV